jgi:hypothetical protein
MKTFVWLMEFQADPKRGEDVRRVIELRIEVTLTVYFSLTGTKTGRRTILHFRRFGRV